jgi:hypothetical protein
MVWKSYSAGLARVTYEVLGCISYRAGDGEDKAKMVG